MTLLKCFRFFVCMGGDWLCENKNHFITAKNLLFIASKLENLEWNPEIIIIGPNRASQLFGFRKFKLRCQRFNLSSSLQVLQSLKKVIRPSSDFQVLFEHKTWKVCSSFTYTDSCFPDSL